jgi:K+-transporting ATPase KdpF subunit
LHFSAPRCFTPSLATVCEGAMTIDYILGAIVTAGLLVYLVYALIRPERF